MTVTESRSYPADPAVLFPDMNAVDVIVCFCLLIPNGPAQNANNQSAAAQANIAVRRTHPCLFDYERGEVPECVEVRTDASRSIASRYLKELLFQPNGLASVWMADGWMYVNHQGIAIITGVPTFDNGADEFHDGLVRFVKNNKYGFANERGTIVVPPVYDGAMPFDQGRAKVCSRCVDKCAGDCEHHIFSGGESLLIDTKGRIVKR